MFAGGENVAGHRQTGPRERVHQPVGVERGNVVVGDDQHVAAAQAAGEQPGVGQQAGADVQQVGTRPADLQRGGPAHAATPRQRPSSAAWMREATCPGVDPAVSTRRSATAA